MTQADHTPAWLASVLVKHGQALVLYARQWCRTPEDVVQDALVQLVSQSKRPDDVARWLFRAVRNGAISAGRSAQRRSRRERRVAVTEVWFDDSATAIDAAAAVAALESLAGELREVVVARLWGELTFSDIGELTGTSSSTAQRRYEQALRQLQKSMEKPCAKTNRSLPN